jgi:hypothetical protein
MSKESARYAQHGRQSVRKATEEPRGVEHFPTPWKQLVESQRPDPSRIPQSQISPGNTPTEPHQRAKCFLRDGVR